MPDFRLRVTFSKTGRLGMLSHLELARALERAVRRADLPYAVTQGYSPHMKIAFGAALPVGVESTCEIFDVSLTEYLPANEALSRLQDANVSDLMPHAARYLQQGEAAASVAYPISCYEVHLSTPASALRVPDKIVVVRKKREKVLNPAEFIRSMRYGSDDDACRLTFELEAKSTGSLRPDVLLSSMIETSEHRDAHALSVTRVSQRSLEE